MDILKFRIQNQFFWKSPELLLIFKELSQALISLQEELNICHRNITPNNIIYNQKEGLYKISGFEYSKSFLKNSRKMGKHTIYNIGNVLLSPEIEENLKNGE